MFFRSFRGTTARDVELQNITCNSGVLPINLGAARLEQNSYTIVHYYNLTPLTEELNDLSLQSVNLQSITLNASEFHSNLENYRKIIFHQQVTIQEKLNSINFSYPPKNPYQTLRRKRSLFPKLGSILKLVTGNLDETDGKRYQEILQDIQTNQINSQRQHDLQYTLSTQVIQRFEQTVKNIEHNELVLKSRISQLSDIVQKEFIELNPLNILVAGEAFNQLIMLYNSILTILQDIENSLTFCRLKTFHPSIMKPNELLTEIQKINTNFPGQVPVNVKSLSDIQRFIEVDCKIANDKIVYFLSFPLNFNTQFDLYFLFPIPTFNNLGYSTVIPNHKYFLKSVSSIKTLSKHCEAGNPFQCFKEDLSNGPSLCESQVLQSGNTSECEHISLEIPDNYVQFIPEINQVLAVFPKTESLKFELSDQVEVKEIQGIFLIEHTKGNIYFRNEKLHFQKDTFGKPTILSNVQTNAKIKFSNTKLKLHDLNLHELSPNQILPVDQHHQELEAANRPWKMLNCFTLISLIVFVFTAIFKSYFTELIQKLKSKGPKANSSSQSHVNQNSVNPAPKSRSVVPLLEGTKI